VDQFFAEIGGYSCIEGDDDDFISTLGIGFRL